MAINGALILNTIRANASPNYQGLVPVADDYNLQQVGNPILSYTAVANEFLSALVNRIALVIVQNRVYNNPLAPLKRGEIPLGQDVEEIFTNPASATAYDINATTELLARTPPDVKAAYHRMNRQDQFPVTISNQALRQAFTSWESLESLIASIVNSLYSGDNIKEYNLMTDLLGTAVNSGFMKVNTVAPITDEESGKSFMKSVKMVSGMMQFPSSNYNAYLSIVNQGGQSDSPVTTWTPKDRQIFIVRSDVLANIDIDVLAYAFNMDKASFLGRTVEVGSFGSVGLAANTLAVIADEGWMQVYDNLTEMTEFYNAKSLSWNYFWNHWQTYSYSPFANAVAFVSSQSSVTAFPAGNSKLPAAKVNQLYSFSPIIVGTNPIVGYSLGSGSADWVQVNSSTGAVSGVPTATATDDKIIIEVKYSDGNSSNVEYTVDVEG